LKIPASIRIKNKVWKICRKWILKDDSGEQVDGLCDPATRTIWLAHGLNKIDLEDTFFHEYLHGIMYEYGYHNTLSLDMQENIAHNVNREIREVFALRLKK